MKIVSVSFKPNDTIKGNGDLSINIDSDYNISGISDILTNGTILIRPSAIYGITNLNIRVPQVHKEISIKNENGDLQFEFEIEQFILNSLLELNLFALKKDIHSISQKRKVDSIINYSKAILSNNIFANNYWFNNENAISGYAENESAYLAIMDKIQKCKSILNVQPVLEDLLEKPKYDFIEPSGSFSFLLNKNRIKEKYNIEYLNLVTQWEISNKPKEERNLIRLRDYQNWNDSINNYIIKLESSIDSFVNEFNIIKKSYNDLLENYSDESGLEKYFEKNLRESISTQLFHLQFKLGYISLSKHLVIDIVLPTKENVPNVKELKQNSKTLEYKEVQFSIKEFSQVYNKIIYSIVFRALYDLFYSDTLDKIDIITLNGWLNDINKGTGHLESKCILSLSVSKSDIMSLSLENIDPEVCFKKLKGISAQQLINQTPVAPIISFNKDDKRFIASEEVLNTINSGKNIAAIGWEEFEHLIRELFEKEFAINGGEVKVTQSSRDGGVDAIAFDPDPIRGGKIIIQSKRYTNVVGVSAIRDLYGTVLNEGATKGIIVTTSHYGQDAYQFANGKPLTLLDGNNLLYLLSKHGYNASINLIEAKEINSKFGNNHT